MENFRTALILAWVFLALLIWQAWQEDYVLPKQEQQAAAQSLTIEQDGAIPQAPAVAAIDSVPSDLPALSSSEATAGDNGQGRIINVTTDLFDIQLDTNGGTLISAKLIDYPVSLDNPDVKLRIMSTSAADYFTAQSGLLTKDKAAGPTHKSIFESEKTEFVMAEGDNQLAVDLVWKNTSGISVTKRYLFTRGSYNINLQHIVKNGSGAAWDGREYRQLQRGEPEDSGNSLMYTYTGGAIYSEQDKYKKYDFDDLAGGDLNQDVKDGWLAMIQHYFLAAFIPPRNETDHFYGKGLANGRVVIGGYTPSVSVAPGQSHEFSGVLYVGPKNQSALADLAKGLDLTVDYGFLTVIAQPMYWVLDWIHGWVHNWGWTIIIFTILIKLLFYKLSETSYKSMANMRKMAPRIQALKERYGDDKQRMQQAMMEIYKTEKINPLGGCLPILLQMPFFIALYWVLLESVELRQAPWILWIQDLSIQDPYFILPLLMGITMWIQQKLNPAPPDPMQAKMMMMLPIVFTVMFAFFPAGLVLYWFFNNLLSIAQQWVITRRIENA